MSHTGDEMGEKISKYRQIEEDLHESNKKFQNLVESSHELIQSIDKNGHFIFVNKAWRGTLGYSKKDYIKTTNRFIHEHEIENVGLILNGLELKRIRPWLNK